MPWTGRPEPSDRAPRDSDREFLAGLGAAQHLADVVAQLFLRDGGAHHRARVAVLLPNPGRADLRALEQDLARATPGARIASTPAAES